LGKESGGGIALVIHDQTLFDLDFWAISGLGRDGMRRTDMPLSSERKLLPSPWALFRKEQEHLRNLLNSSGRSTEREKVKLRTIFTVFKWKVRVPLEIDVVEEGGENRG
jgi:hypothetical protein